MPASRFFALSTLANLCISAVYAAVGALSANVNSFLLAVAVSTIVPGLAIVFVVLAFNFLGDGLRASLDPYKD